MPVTHIYLLNRYFGSTLSPIWTVEQFEQNKRRKGTLGGGLSVGSYRLFAGGWFPRFKTSFKLVEQQILHSLIVSNILFNIHPSISISKDFKKSFLPKLQKTQRGI